MTNKVGQCAFHGKNIRQEDWLTAAAWPWQAFEAATVVIFEVVLHQKTHRELKQKYQKSKFWSIYYNKYCIFGLDMLIKVTRISILINLKTFPRIL